MFVAWSDEDVGCEWCGMFGRCGLKIAVGWCDWMSRFDVVGVAWLVTRGLAYATARSGFAFTRSRHGETWLEANASLRGRLSSTRSLFPGCEEYCGAENTLVGCLATFTRLSWQQGPSRKGRHAKRSLRRHIWLKSLQTRRTAHSPTTPVVRSSRCSVDECQPVHNTVSDERCRSSCLQSGRSRQTVHNTAAPSVVNTHALFGRAHADSTGGTAQCCRRR